MPTGAHWITARRYPSAVRDQRQLHHVSRAPTAVVLLRTAAPAPSHECCNMRIKAFINPTCWPQEHEANSTKGIYLQVLAGVRNDAGHPPAGASKLLLPRVPRKLRSISSLSAQVLLTWSRPPNPATNSPPPAALAIDIAAEPPSLSSPCT